jgi:guanine nucleotide-binding protein subunit alpha
MKIIHQGGFSNEEPLTYHPIIYRNVLDSGQTPSFIFSEEVAEAIHQLWQDPIIRKVMDHTRQFYLMDSAT